MPLWPRQVPGFRVTSWLAVSGGLLPWKPIPHLWSDFSRAEFFPRLQASWSPCPESGLWDGAAQRPHAGPAVAPGSDGKGCWVHSELPSLLVLRHMLAALLVGFPLLSSGSQSVFRGSATSASLGNFLEMQICRPFSRPRISSGAQRCVSGDLQGTLVHAQIRKPLS